MGGLSILPHPPDQRVESATLWIPPIENQGSQTLLIHPGFLRAAAIHGLLSANWVVASVANGYFTSCKEAVLLDIPVSHIGAGLFGLKTLIL